MIGFYIVEALKSFRRSKLATLFSILTLAIGIFFISLSILMVLLSSKVDERLIDKIEINIFLDDSITSTRIEIIRKQLISLDNIRAVNFVSKEEALARFKKETGEDFTSVISINPLPNSFNLKLSRNINEEEIANIVNQINTITGVNEVVYDYDITLSILEFIGSVKISIYTSAILFTLISLYLIYSNTKLSLLSELDRYNTMKLVGAKLKTIKIPLFIRGLIIGLIASCICILFINVLLIILQKFSFQIRYLEYLYLFNIILLILGCLLGPFGSGIFTRKLNLKIVQKNN